MTLSRSSEKSRVNTSSALAILDLWGNPIKDNGALALSEELKINFTLTTFELNCRESGPIRGTKANPTLTTLNFWNNSVGEKGAQAEALRTSSTLAILILAGNLLETMVLWHSLAILELQNNWTGDNGALALLPTMTSNANMRVWCPRGPLRNLAYNIQAFK
ncbi:hypothetical protein BG006_010485 [Podila minutissima]|uniref:Uncharacterized protein n=1 Tax=Podila minutissima TaxID=64525 RepID=A0A9P5SSZ0_9FUNG|nr:hypothetical protein BG006_010485 [Podila minutissima]